MYADINGLKMFYEIRGTSDPAGVPVVLYKQPSSRCADMSGHAAMIALHSLPGVGHR